MGCSVSRMQNWMLALFLPLSPEFNKYLPFHISQRRKQDLSSGVHYHSIWWSEARWTGSKTQSSRFALFFFHQLQQKKCEEKKINLCRRERLFVRRQTKELLAKPILWPSFLILKAWFIANSSSQLNNTNCCLAETSHGNRTTSLSPAARNLLMATGLSCLPTCKFRDS